MISDDVFDRFRDAWAASIPEAYRPRAERKAGQYTGEGHGAIVLPMPPDATLERWVELLMGSVHLRSEQRGRPKVAPKRAAGAKRQGGLRIAA